MQRTATATRRALDRVPGCDAGGVEVTWLACPTTFLRRPGSAWLLPVLADQPLFLPSLAVLLHCRSAAAGMAPRCTHTLPLLPVSFGLLSLSQLQPYWSGAIIVPGHWPSVSIRFRRRGSTLEAFL